MARIFFATVIIVVAIGALYWSGTSGTAEAATWIRFEPVSSRPGAIVVIRFQTLGADGATPPYQYFPYEVEPAYLWDLRVAPHAGIDRSTDFARHIRVTRDPDAPTFWKGAFIFPTAGQYVLWLNNFGLAPDPETGAVLIVSVPLLVSEVRIQ